MCTLSQNGYGGRVGAKGGAVRTSSALPTWASMWKRRPCREDRWRPYRVECTGSLSTSEVKRHRARLVLGWGTAWELPGVLPAFTCSPLPEKQQGRSQPPAASTTGLVRRCPTHTQPARSSQHSTLHQSDALWRLLPEAPNSKPQLFVLRFSLQCTTQAMQKRPARSQQPDVYLEPKWLR